MRVFAAIVLLLGGCVVLEPPQKRTTVVGAPTEQQDVSSSSVEQHTTEPANPGSNQYSHPDLADEWRMAEIMAGRYNGPVEEYTFRQNRNVCSRFRKIADKEPVFTATQNGSSITVQQRVSETCARVLNYIAFCRTVDTATDQGVNSECPDSWEALKYAELVNGGPLDGNKLPPWIPSSLRGEISQTLTERAFAESAETTQTQQTEPPSFCEELSRLETMVAKIPADVREEYLSRSIHVVVNDPWSSSGTSSAYVETLKKYQDARMVAFKKGLAAMDTRSRMTVGEMRTVADQIDCLGDFAPDQTSCDQMTGPNKIMCERRTRGIGPTQTWTTSELAQAVRVKADRIHAEWEERQRCLADRKCKRKLDMEEILIGLCSDIEELAEVKKRLKQRNADARRHGVINAWEQGDDLEVKNDLVEVIGAEKARFRKVAGRAFRKSDCRDY